MAETREHNYARNRVVLLVAIGTSMAACNSREVRRNDAGSDVDTAVADGPVVDAAVTDGSEGDAAAERDSRSIGFTPPSCLAALFSTCRPSGACVVQSEQSDAGNIWQFCYASGVRVEHVACRLTGSSSDLRVFKPDGTLCYTVERQWGPICESSSLTWKDPTGRVVATGDWSGSSSTSHRARCEDTGEISEALVNNQFLEPIVGVEVPSECTSGRCP